MGATSNDAGQRKSRPGGRSQRIRQSVLAATVQELRATGYQELALPKVAERAQVALTTVHRRWPSKALLVAEAVDAHVGDPTPIADDGDLRSQLETFAQTITDYFRDPLVVDLMASLLALPDEETERVRALHWRSRAVPGAEIVARAAARAEIPPQPDDSYLVEMIVAPIWLRIFVTKRETDREYIAALADEVSRIARRRRPAGAGPPP